MAAVTTMVIAGAAVAAAGTAAYSAQSQSEAAGDANAANAGNMAATNAMNLKMFQEGRGSKGNALLPMYFKKGDKKFEPRLARETMRTYDYFQQRRPTQEVAGRAQGAIRSFAPAQDAAEQTVNDLYSGALTEEALGNLDPLAAERLRSAQTLREVGQESLAENLSGINRDAAAKGFVGDTFGSRLLAGEAIRRYNSDAAMREAAAREQNETDAMRIKQTGLLTRLQSVNLPYAMTQNKINTQNLPENAALDQAARRQQLLNFFRIGPGAFQYQNMPAVQPVAGTGQIVGQGVSAGAGAVGNYYANKALIAQMNNRGAVQGNYDPNAPAWYNDYLNQPVNQSLGPT